MIDCLQLISSVSSHGGPYFAPLSSFPRLRVNQYLKLQLPSKLHPDVPPLDRLPPSTPPIPFDHGLQKHLQTPSIPASKCISELHDLGLPVYLQTWWITASKCIREFNLILASKCISELLNLGLQMPHQTPLITASTCISKFNLISPSECIAKLAQSRPPSASLSSAWSLPRSASLSYTISASWCISKPAPSLPPSASLSSTRWRPPSASPNSLDRVLQVHLPVVTITASKCSSKVSSSISMCSGDHAPVPSAARLAVCIYIERPR